MSAERSRGRLATSREKPSIPTIITLSNEGKQAAFFELLSDPSLKRPNIKADGVDTEWKKRLDLRCRLDVQRNKHLEKRLGMPLSLELPLAEEETLREILVERLSELTPHEVDEYLLCRQLEDRWQAQIDIGREILGTLNQRKSEKEFPLEQRLPLGMVYERDILELRRIESPYNDKGLMAAFFVRKLTRPKIH